MGCLQSEVNFQSGVNQSIRVATLNYSGILNSPFEFFSSGNYSQEQGLSKVFDNLLRSQSIFTNEKQFNWGMGKIDQKLQKQRYTPVYRNGAGVENGNFLSEQQFKVKWTEEFEKGVEQIKFSWTKEQMEQARIFDTLCYKTIVTYLYRVSEDEKQTLNKLIQEKRDVARYLQFCGGYFSRPYINQSRKIKLSISLLKLSNLQIIFFQQANQVFQQALREEFSKRYIIKGHQSSTSLIMISKSLARGQECTQQKMKMIPSLKDSLYWNGDTAVLFIGNFILISGHLSSKGEKNAAQTKLVYEHLQMLKNTYKNHIIIVGIDANNPDLAPKDFYVFPPEKETCTVHKKRTHIQAQYNKADIEAKKRSDYIVTNVKFSEGKVSTIQDLNGDGFSLPQVQNSYLPNSEHPFDHLLVRVSFDKAMLR